MFFIRLIGGGMVLPWEGVLFKRCTFCGVEAMHMVKKEQIDLRDQSLQSQNIFINQLFGLIA